MPPLFDRAALTAINHLLAGEGWASERLRPFAGRRLCLQGGPMRLELEVDEQGLFRSPDGAGTADVCIELPADAPWRLLSERDSVFQQARISGTADFAETLGFVFRNLGWDVEADLAEYLGDIPARRLVMGGRRFLAWQGQVARNLAGNVAEYVSEEADLVVPQRDVDRFRDGVAALDRDLAALERRLQNLS